MLHCIYALEETECNSACRLEEIELLFCMILSLVWLYICEVIENTDTQGYIVSVLLASFETGCRFNDKVTVEIDFRLAKNYSQ